MGRKSKEQICKELKNERSRLYRKRSKLVKKKKRSKAEEETYKEVQNRLSEIKNELFKCGKRYGRLKKQRTKLKQHQYYLNRKIQKIRDKINTKGLTKKEKAKLKKELNITGKYSREALESINTVEKAMMLPVGEIKSSKGIDRGVLSVGGGKFVIQDIIWVMTESWHSWLNSGYFNVLVIDDELIDLDDNPIVATAAVYEAYDWAMSWQHVYGTPFFFAFGDAKNGYLEIKVREYTTDMYSEEIKKHDGGIEEL